MSETAKITARNQITLPADVHSLLGVAPGDRVDFVRAAAGNFELRSRKEIFADLRGIVKPPKPVTGAAIDRWIAEARFAAYGAEEE